MTAENTVAMVGVIYEAAYPFVREEVVGFTEHPMQTWRPGIQYNHAGPEDEGYANCNALGAILLTVVSIHKPGRFPTRVFYTRQWRDPDGKTFGKGALRCTTTATFNRLRAGYRIPYVIEPIK